MSCSSSSCRCPNCLKWWQEAGAIPDENGYIGPFSRDEIETGELRTLREFFPDSLEFRYYPDGNDFVVEYKNYDSFPQELSSEDAKRLMNYFGATDITRNFETISNGGCETCGHGSEYGHEVRVVKPTKNLHLLPQYNVRHFLKW